MAEYNTEIKKVKIKELPQKEQINDTDIFIVSDEIETYKANVNDFMDCFKNNESFSNHYVKKSEIGIPDGIVPFDENLKIAGNYITYGNTDNTAYEGSAGKMLKQNLDTHIADNNAHNLINVLSEHNSASSSHLDMRELIAQNSESIEAITEKLKDAENSGALDTKNTAGSTDDAEKLFIIGAKTQESNPVTYSNHKVYIDGDCLYSNGTRVKSEIVSEEEPTNQFDGDYWLQVY